MTVPAGSPAFPVPRSLRRLYGLVAGAFLVFVAAGVIVLHLFAGVGHPTPSFVLVDHHGRSVSSADLFRKPSFVYFGFAGCSSVCPVALQKISDALGQLERRDIPAAGFLITTDPGNDTPAALARYLENFEAPLTGLTGGKKQLEQVYGAFRVFVPALRDNHSNHIYVLDQERKIIAVLEGDTDADELTRIIIAHVSKGESS
jgi:protein SCO1/2